MRALQYPHGAALAFCLEVHLPGVLPNARTLWEGVQDVPLVGDLGPH